MRREAYNPLLKSYPDSDRINAVSEGAEVLYTRLIAQSDDAGRYYGDADWVLAKLFTSRMLAKQVTVGDIEKRLKELEKVGLIRRYRVNGDTFLEMIDVMKRLRRDVNPQVVFPSAVESLVEESVTRPSRSRNADVPLDPVTEPVTEPATNPNVLSPDGDGQTTSGLVDWIRWWNGLHSQHLVSAGANEEPPSQAAQRAWGRVQKSREVQQLLSNRIDLEAAIREQEFLRQPWFRLEKLLGGTNRDGEYIARKILDRGYKENRNAKPSPRNQGAGVHYDASKPAGVGGF